MHYLFPWHVRYSSVKFRRDGDIVTAEPSGKSGSLQSFFVDTPERSGNHDMVEWSIYSHDIASLRYDVRVFNGKEFTTLARFDNEGLAWLEAALYALAKTGIETGRLRSVWTQALRLSQEHCDGATRADPDSGLRYRLLTELPRGCFLEKPCVVDNMSTHEAVQGLPCFTNGRSVLYHLRYEAGERIALISTGSGLTIDTFVGPQREIEALRALITRPYRGNDLSGHELLNLHDARSRAEELALSLENAGSLLAMGGFTPQACPLENLCLSL